MLDREGIRELNLLTKVSMTIITIESHYDNQVCLLYNTYLTTEPSPPANITVIDKTCNSLSVQWSPPSDTGGLEITGYMVDVAENSFSTKTTMTRIDITNLSPDTTYQVKVETITHLKSGSKSTDITTQSRSKHINVISDTYYYYIVCTGTIITNCMCYFSINR